MLSLLATSHFTCIAAIRKSRFASVLLYCAAAAGINVSKTYTNQEVKMDCVGEKGQFVIPVPRKLDLHKGHSYRARAYSLKYKSTKFFFKGVGPSQENKACDFSG